MKKIFTTATIIGVTFMMSQFSQANDEVVGDIDAGKNTYSAKCAMCHGADPTKNQNKITSAKDAAKITDALGRVPMMAHLKSIVSDEDKANISAYVASLTAEK